MTLRPTVGLMLLCAAVAGAETVQLPYQAGSDGQSAWLVNQNGQLMQQGNQPVFAQAGLAILNGQASQLPDPQARLDEKTREIVLSFAPSGSYRQVRRIKPDEAGGVVRVVDTIENLSDRDLNLTVQFSTSVRFGVQNAEVVADTKQADGQLGWVADTGINRCAMSLFAGKGARFLPSVRYTAGNNMVMAVYGLKLDPREKIALAHWHGTFDTSEEADRWITQAREAKLLSDLDPDVRKSVINVPGVGGGEIGGQELLRGDTLDVVELRNGDLLRGDLAIEAFKLETAYGTIEVPVDKVAGLVNVGDYRPRQLVVTGGGEIFGGRLAENAVPIRLSSGQTTRVPLSQINRLGYRTGGQETGEWAFRQPMVFLRSGERCNIAPTTEPVSILTRYGPVTLPADQVAVATLKSDTSVHEVRLTNGTKLTGLIDRPTWPLKLTTAGASAPIDFPLAALDRVQLRFYDEGVASPRAELTLQGGDVICSRLIGQLKLQTAFDTLTLPGPEIKSLQRPGDGSPDVRVELADGSIFRGTLETPTLSARLVGDTPIDVPAAALVSYANPQPFPSAATVEKARAAIEQLGDDDWKRREAAEADLVAMGPPVVAVLDEAIAGQPPEAQQRLRAILKRLRPAPAPKKSRTTAVPPDVILNKD